MSLPLIFRLHRKGTVVPAAVLLCVLYASCASTYNFSSINADIAAGDFSAAYGRVEADSAVIYNTADTVLHDLDRGILSHYAKEYERSNIELAAAEQGIYEKFAKSVSQSVASAITNDTVIDYAGDPYEDIYTNVFMALNYIHLQQYEEALVEIRRFDNKLKTLSAPYQQELAQMSSQLKDAPPAEIPSLEFHNSALARWLSLILYRSAGNREAAQVDERLLRQAFASQSSLYPFPLPASLSGELESGKGGRLNILALSGLSPIKKEQTVRLLAPDGSFYYKVALPVMKERPSAAALIRARVFDDAGTLIAERLLEPIESIELIAEDTFRLKQAAIYAKTLIRSLSKAATTAAIGYAARQDGMEMLALLQVASAIFTEASERADIRVSRYFPALASVTGIWLDEGVYSVEIQYEARSGRPVFVQSFSNIAVRTGGLHFVESVCLK